jgi:ABC-type uncharacterized transport system ATPase subunit
MSDAPAVLTLRQVTLPPGRDYDAGLADTSLSVARGEWALVRTEPHATRLPLADVVEGLVAPTGGRVEFLGARWEERSADAAAQARARIGRVFCGAAWISNLDVDENITLRERHHSRRPVAEIEAEALALARRFGFDALPSQRPAWVPREILMRAQWVRALLGSPALLLLEHPEQDASEPALDALLAILAERRAVGAAIVWFTSDPRVWNHHGLDTPARYALHGEKLETVGEKAP